MAVLCIAALSSCASQAGHAKVTRYSTASEAEKISVKLLRLEHHVRTEGQPLVATAAAMGIHTVGDGVQLDILTSPLDANIVQKFLLPGVTVRHISMQYRRISVVISDIALLYHLARIPEVRMIVPEYGAMTSRSAQGSCNGV